MQYVNAFITGGVICTIGQVILDKTRFTAARLLVLFVVAGCFLSGLGIYDKIVDYGGAGATVPLPGFGNLLANGVKDEIDLNGPIGILTGGLKATAAGISAAIVFSVINAFIFEPKEKS